MQEAHEQLEVAHAQLVQTLAILQAASPSKTAVAAATPPSTRLSSRSNSIDDNSNNQAGTAISHTSDVAATAVGCEVTQEMQPLPFTSIGSAQPPSIEALKAMVEEVRSKRRWVRETLRQVTKCSLSIYKTPCWYKVHDPTPLTPFPSPSLATTGTSAVRRGPRALPLVLAEQHPPLVHPTTRPPRNHPLASSLALDLRRWVDWLECSTCRHPP